MRGRGGASASFRTAGADPGDGGFAGGGGSPGGGGITFQNENMLIRQSVESNVADCGNYGLVELSSYRYSDVATIKAAHPDCKVIAYKAASDCFDEGWGNTLPNLATRLQSRSAVTYNEILDHDLGNPSDKWVMTSDGSSPITPWFGFSNVYGGNIGKESFQQRWLERVLEKFENEPDWDGVFVDNVMIQQPGGWPAELPSQAAWTNAMADFIAYVGPGVQAEGKIFGCNTTYFISGDGASDTGVGIQGWWETIAPYVTFLLMEHPLQKAYPETDFLKLQGAGYPFSWDGYQALVGLAQDAGCIGVLNVNLNGNQGNVLDSDHVRYVRASALLDWDGTGMCFSIDFGGSSSPWAGPVATDLGQPIGARGETSGLHWRHFDNGYAIVNPTGSQITATIGGQSRTIDSGDGYLGA